MISLVNIIWKANRIKNEAGFCKVLFALGQSYLKDTLFLLQTKDGIKVQGLQPEQVKNSIFTSFIKNHYFFRRSTDTKGLWFMKNIEQRERLRLSCLTLKSRMETLLWVTFLVLYNV